MGNWSSFKDGIEYEDIRKFFLNKCKELGLKSKYRNGEITFEDVDSYDYFMGDFSDDGVLSIYYPFTLKKEYFMSNFEDYDEFLAQFVDVYDSAMIEKRLRKTESKKSAKKSLTEKELKMDVWEWGEVKGTDEELCNHIAEYAEEKGIEYMEITEDEFEYLKKDYLKKYKSMKESKDTDFFNAMAKKFNFTKDEIKRYKDKTYISVIGVLFDRIRSVPAHSDEWYNAMNDCWEGIQTAKENGFDVAYEERTYDKIMMTPNYNRESKKSARKSLTEKMLQDICNSWVIGKVKGEFKGRDYCHEGNDYSLYNIANIIEDALRDNYIVEFDGDDKTKTVIFNLINEDGKNVGTLEIFPDERYSAENYEDGFNWEDLNMKEIIKDFEDTLGYKIEYLKSDKRFDYSDRFWYKESKKSDKKSMKETISKSTWGDWIVDKVERVEGFYNGSPNVRPQLINNLIESIGLNANGHILTFDDIAEEITKGVRAYKLKDLDSWHVHLGHNNDGLRVDLNAKVEHFSEVINHNGKYTVVSVYFYVDEQGTNKEYDFGFVADVLVEINPYIDFVLEESKKSVRKSIKESVKPEIQLMVNNIIDELIGEYSSKEWDSLSEMEKWDIVTRKYYSFGGKIRYVSEVRDLVIENMNHPFNVVFESKKSMKKSLKESKDSDFFNGIAKEYHFSKDEKTRYKDKTHISAIGVLFDRINDAIKIYGRNSDEEYNALNDCWSVITSAKQNGWNVDYEEDKWNKIAGLPNYH